MKHFIFWQRWLLILGLIFFASGISVALLSFFTPIAALNRLIDPAFWGTQPVNEATAHFQRWVYGIAMATMAGWGVCIAFVAYFPFKRQEKWAWTCLLAGSLVWYFPDTAISLHFGVYANALGNTVFLAAVLLPLIFTRRLFRNSSQPR